MLADEVWARIRPLNSGQQVNSASGMVYRVDARRRDGSGRDDQPMPWLAKLPAVCSGSRMNRELAALAISRVARSRLGHGRRAPEPHRRNQLQGEAWAWGQIAWQAARHMPDALDWYKAGDTPLSDEVLEWKDPALPCVSRTGSRQGDDREDARGPGQATGTDLLARAGLPCRWSDG